MVDRPVVEWWVHHWVLNLGQDSFHGILLLENNIIWANENLHSEVSIVHGISHNNWVNGDWYSLRKLIGRGVRLFHLKKSSSHWSSLSELSGDWAWLISDKVLQVNNVTINVNIHVNLFVNLGLRHLLVDHVVSTNHGWTVNSLCALHSLQWLGSYLSKTNWMTINEDVLS